MKIQTNKLNLFLLAIALILFLVVFIVAISGFFDNPGTEPSTSPTRSLAPTPTSGGRIKPPALEETISPQNQGVFSVSFAKAPRPDAFSITLASSPSQPPFSTQAVPFTTEFQDAGKLMVITTTESLRPNSIYTLYVRLKSNNHIVVKHRYENKDGSLIIIDTN